MMSDRMLPATYCDPSAFAIDAEVAIALLADMQIRRAAERGEFDDLPGSGEPLDLPDHHDPDWWLKKLMKREGLAMLPPSIQLRKDDAALDALLDDMHYEAAVRREVEEFNERVTRARYSLPQGPPLITMPRDVEATVSAWAQRRAERAEQARQKALERERAAERPRRGFFGARGRNRRSRS
jgi:hypothetical protein